MPRRLAVGIALLAGCGLAGLLASCQRAPRPTSEALAPRYVVGAPYEMGGVWSYPRADTTLVQTGLATVVPDTAPGRRTADDETFDPTALVAAHRTLQLPAILEVTNLENGRALLVRLNDRGPASPARVLGLSPRAAALLGARDGTQIRLAVRAGESAAVSGDLPGDDRPTGATAVPVGAVTREALPPPPGAREAGQVREAASLPRARTAADDTAPTVPLRLPEQVTQGPPAPGQLFVEAGTFSRRDMAARQAARIPGGRVEAFGPAGRQQFRVRVGPLGSVADADTRLEQVLGSGVSEARILVD